MAEPKKKPSRRRLGLRSRTKGKTWERAVAALLRPIFGEHIHRGHQDARARASSQEGCDVDGSPFWCETKHGKQTNPRAALRQCREAQVTCDDERPAVVVSKDDRPPPGWKVGKPLDPPLATMELGAWLGLVADWVRLKKAAGEELEYPYTEIDR